MSQRSKNIQEQTQEQRQTITQQQLMFVRLLELPTEGLEERVRAEVLENPALEMADPADHPQESADDKFDDEAVADSATDDGDEPDYGEEAYENEVGEEELAALGDYRTEDDIPDYALNDYPSATESGVAGEIPFSTATSFYELMMQQLGECDITPQERDIAEYLIGSLDDDGLLRKPLPTIVEELAIYRGTYATEEELVEVLHVIQGFDPVGVGAQSLQECLMLQLRRKPDTPAKQVAMRILERAYDDFSYKRWERIMQNLDISEELLEDALDELTRLNPRPGSSLSEAMGMGLQRIIPDFFIHVDDEDRVTFSLNDGNVPDLRVSESFSHMMEAYAHQKETRESREAMLFLKQKMEAAQGFIDIVEMRRRTLVATMQAIVDMQRDFFLEGDERLLKPMLMKDVAERAGVDVSTVSRVSNCKYAETPFGIFPLKSFFGDSYRLPNFSKQKKEETDDGKEPPKVADAGKEEPTTLRQIRAIIQECVAGEDKRRPMTDEQLVEKLKEQGYDLARRTVAKYRTQLGIPVARMRR
ncbi:MAG: RNA polymerase factor sigma-54 [Bacteroidaceae bacterium]|nr:RNA polymerase factor sigma-54 [Bacteroidaceae bacterium]